MKGTPSFQAQIRIYEESSCLREIWTTIEVITIYYKSSKISLRIKERRFSVMFCLIDSDT